MTVYYKLRQILLQNAKKSLLQNAPGFLLKNATALLQNAAVITKCKIYYKLRQYNCLPISSSLSDNVDCNPSDKSAAENESD